MTTINQQALDNMKSRRSCRNFLPALPSRELIEKVLEAGTWAPTGHNRQSPIIIVITKPELRQRLSKLNAKVWNEMTIKNGGTPHPDMDPFYGAPVVILVLADRKIRTYHHDGCAVLTNMANAAHAVGLGSCWIHRAKQEFESEEGKAILKELGIEGDYEGIDHLILGYPSKPLPQPLPRKADYVRWVE